MEIQSQLAQFVKTGSGCRLAVLGIGSPMRSDDAAGMRAVRLLGKLVAHPDLLLVGGDTAPENYTGVIKQFRPDKLIVIDAAQLGLSPGRTAIISQADVGGISVATHHLPLPIMLQYLKSEIGCDILLIGIQSATTEYGRLMTRAVGASARRLATELAALFKETNPQS
jgi:hydrogenase 3 maturation protease